MVNRQSRSEIRVKRHNRMRNRFTGTAEKPRLAVFRSNNHMYAQIIDDTVSNTLVTASTVEREINAELERTNDKTAAAYVGTVIIKRALEESIRGIVFDEGGFIYQGKVQVLADATREADLDFQERRTSMERTIVSASQMELNDKIVTIRGVSKTIKGGCTMRFSALVVVGDGNGHVGAGLDRTGKAPETTRKGREAAIKNLVEIPIDENKSIPYDFIGKFENAAVLLKRAPESTGIIAGGPVRSVLEMAGIKDTRTKSLGSNNKTGVVLTTLAGLTFLKMPEESARLRGKSMEEIVD